MAECEFCGKMAVKCYEPAFSMTKCPKCKEEVFIDTICFCSRKCFNKSGYIVSGHSIEMKLQCSSGHVFEKDVEVFLLDA